MDFFTVLLYAAVGFVAGVGGALFLTQARVRQAEAAAVTAARARVALTERLRKQESDLADAQAVSSAALAELDVLRQQLREAREKNAAPQEVLVAPVAPAAPPALAAAEPPPAVPAVAPSLRAEPVIAASTLALPEAAPPESTLPDELPVALPAAPVNGVNHSHNPRFCSFCGSIRSVELARLDSAATDEDPMNLIWTCHPCKTRLDQVLKRASFVRRSRPFRPVGARNLREWSQAVSGIAAGPPAIGAEAIDVIRATPPERRAEFIASYLRRRRPAIPLTIDLKSRDVARYSFGA